MRTLFLISCFAFLFSGTNSISYLQCRLPAADISTDWVTVAESCYEKLKSHVNEELDAAMTYLAMGAHFSKDSVNRPGFAELFFKSASEEREHAIKIIEYLLMRGGLVTNLSKIIKDPKPVSKSLTWDSGYAALKMALDLETNVTSKIRQIIVECEKSTRPRDVNDYHIVDYLTSEFLTEQYKGQKELANRISTLGKMIEMQKNSVLGEFLFDKKLLKGEI